MVDEAKALMTQVEALEKEKNSYGTRSGSRVYSSCTQIHTKQHPFLKATQFLHQLYDVIVVSCSFPSF